MLAGEYKSGASHVGRQLVDLLDAFYGGPDDGRIPQIADDEFVRLAEREFVVFEVDASHPISFALQALHKVAADEAAGAVDKYAMIHIFHSVFLRFLRDR